MRLKINQLLNFFKIVAFCLAFAPFTIDAQTTYYSKATGNANLVATWGTNTDGSGSAPTNFTQGDIFIVRSGSALTTSSALTIQSSNSRAGELRIATGGTLTANHVISFNSPGQSPDTKFEIDNNGRYIHGIATDISASILTADVSSFLPGSTFEISTTSNNHKIVSGTIFDNFTVSNNATIDFSSNNTILIISNVLNISSGSTLRFSTTNSLSYLVDGGAMTTAGGGLLRTSSSSTINLPTGITWSFQVNYDGNSGSQRIQGGRYTNLNTTGNNRSIASDALITIAGTFTPGSGTFTIGNNATIEYGANGSLTIPILPYQNLTISGTGTKTLGANLTVFNTLAITNVSGFLSINGNTLTLNGAATLINGKLIGSATSNLTVSDNVNNSFAGIGFSQSASENQLNTFTINRPNGGAILINNLNVINRLVITAGSLNTNNNTIGLISTSIAATARVDVVGTGGGITYGTSGGVRVERFIPAGFRSYRDLTPSVQTFSSSILANWQENGATPAGYGTHITGVAGTPGVDLNTGLDKTQTGNSSLFTYNGTSFPTVTNTASTPLDPYRGYRLLVRGDRNANIITLPTPTTMNTATVLRVTGKLIYGDVNFSTSGVSNTVFASSYALSSSSTTAFSLVGNPYACPVSWGKVLSNAGTANIQNTYWYFDPTLGINGVYATWLKTGGNNSETGTSNGVGFTNNFIQSGQAIFVRNNNSISPTLQFKESNKSISSSAVSVFNSPSTEEPPLNKIGLLLQRFVTDRGNVIMDGATILFSNNNTNDVLTTEDAGKITNGNENLAIVNRTSGTSLLSIESRKLLADIDSIPLMLWRVNNNTNYTLNIIPSNFSSNGKLVFLRDRFLNKEIFIKSEKDTTKVEFTTLSTDSSSFYTRFTIIPKQPILVQPSTPLVSLTGTLNGAGVLLAFTPVNELNLLMYEVEKSTNGIEFTSLTRIYPNGSNTYSYIDSSLPIGKVYYRIKTFQNDAGYFNSNIVILEPNNNRDFISVYPNPVTNNMATILMNQLEQGNYQVSLISQDGKSIFLQTIRHNGSSTTQQIRFNRNFANGVYHLHLVNSTTNKQYSTKIIFNNR